MLSVCLVFLYMLLSAYIVGFLVLAAVGRAFGREGCRKIKPVGYVMAGLVTVTVYAQFFSLFYKVGLLANLLLVLVCMTTAAVFREKLWKLVKEQGIGISRGKKIFYVFLFLLFAYGTSRGIIHYDTGLYHAQSIRWIEEYGVVEGLGNLHCRLAYNSSAFGLSALYSFSFLGGQSYHCAAGFFALLLAGTCSEVAKAWKRKRLLLADIARLMGIYYLMVIFDEMISPASDYFMVLTVFYLIIRYLELAEEGEKEWLPYALLALLGVYAVSLKLSAAFIVLLAVKPAGMLVKERNGKGVAGFLGLGMIILLPFLVRNVLISGWLVYPFTAVDLFPVDWKIPKEIADYDAKEIQVWGRGIYDVSRYGEPAGKWMGSWFASQTALDRLFILAGLGAVPISFAALAAGAVKRRDRQRDMMLAAVTVNLSFLFWMFSAPLIRYGCVYVWLAAPLTFGGLALWLVKEERWGRYFWRGIYIVLVFAGLYKFWAWGRETVSGYSAEYFLAQKDYENYEVEEYWIEGVKFYCPAEGDRTGYEAFPSSPSQAGIKFRGTGLEDGFMSIE